MIRQSKSERCSLQEHRSVRMGPTATVGLVVVAALFCCTEGFIGMNWGRMSAQRLLPSQVVDLMLQNGIRNVRIPTSQSDLLKAFQGSGINLTISLFNGLQPRNMSAARAWAQSKYDLLRVNNIQSVNIGTGVYPFNWGGVYVLDYDINWRALNYVQAALNEIGLGHTKASIVHYSGELIPNITKPSEAAFRDNIKDRMSELLRFLRDNNAPFLVDFRPIGDLERCSLDPSFAFPDNKSKLVINDINGAVYTNGFLWQYDCFAWALEKLNFSDIKVVVTAVGWPTDGYPGASADNAERYYNYLLPMVTSNKGSPKRPGAPIDVFINSLADEPKMKIDVALAPFDRHWGIYRSNGQPKYKVDLSGRGQDIYPTTVKGIMRMPQRWCVFSGNSTDTYKVRRQVELACSKGDCTTLAPGASCSNLGFGKTASYAFNVYFQTHFQNEKACDFEGLSYITDQDPSTEDCLFPVEVVRGNQLIEFSAALALNRSLNVRGAVVVIVLYIFL